MEVGIVGKPNVGKSTFFRALSLKDAEIANFPFTTIKPNIGVGYVRTECGDISFGVECTPKNSLCIRGNRFVPVKLIDVAGLVPGAHEGKGLGNQFLDDLRRADVLIHVVDIAGRTNEKGENATGYDPTEDIRFLNDEIDHWFCQILERNWSKITSKVKHSSRDLIDELTLHLAGLGIKEHHVTEAMKNADLGSKKSWGKNDLRDFAVELRETSKPLLVAGNKIDLDEGNFERLRDEYDIIPVCSEAELALRQAQATDVISYIPGDSGFELLKEVPDKQGKALDYIKENILGVYGSTGVQQCLNKAVFDLLGMIVVYPVENENKLADKEGNILPDALLLPRESSAIDLAYRIHSDIGDRFIGAIDCKTKMKVGRDHKLENGDVIKIITGR
ncbi:MAG: redox-regulated ATPase YchF [Candidatus Altiarchaeota archaeon]|nr:redox-regulated ATPase YchF [Candidatus Altiarchaeota archaeon]